MKTKTKMTVKELLAGILRPRKILTLNYSTSNERDIITFFMEKYGKKERIKIGDMSFTIWSINAIQIGYDREFEYTIELLLNKAYSISKI